MKTPSTGKITGANNAMILDAIRNESSLEYTHRIPAATQAGIDNVFRNLVEYTPLWNEFVGALINKIGMTVGRSMTFSNPLKRFKKGMLEWGDTVEEYQVGLLKATAYNPDVDYLEGSIFGRALVDVQSNFHKINRQDKYKLTTNDDLLKRAFFNEGGLSQFVSHMMNAPLASDEFDEMCLMIELLSQYESMGGFFRVQVPDISTINADAQDARVFTRTVRALADTIKYPSTKFNASKMPSYANADSLILLTNPTARATMDVEALAAAFNISYADVPFSIISLPEEKFNIDGCQGILVTADFFQVYDSLIKTTSIYNPEGLATNHWWHHHSVISASRFTPAVMLTTLPGDDVIEIRGEINTITSVAIENIDGTNATNVAPGLWYQAVATFTTIPADFAGELGVTFKVTGNNSTKTSISQNGVLKVSPTESAASIVIQVWDSNAKVKFTELPVTVSKNVVGDTYPEWPIDKTPTPPVGP